jgi:tetrahydromethanopterin S-methyltransferase subunit G
MAITGRITSAVVGSGGENALMGADPSKLVYGTILVATLLAAESARQETYAQTAGGVVIALLVYWLAASYAQFTGERLEAGEPFRYGALLRTVAHEVGVIYGAVVPLAVLLVLWAAGTALATAVTVAIWTAAAIIVATEVLIGIRADLTGRELVRQTAFGIVLGLLVVALRVLLH